MDIVLFAAAAFASIFHTSVGSISVKCNDVDPFSTSNVKCSCYNPGGLGITWYRDDTSLTDCFLSSEICFSSVGYTFAVNSTTFTYTIEFGSYSYTDCSSVSCNDSTNPSDSELRKISIDETSLSPTIQLLSEPISNKSNGIISFKTDCLYKANSTWINVTAKWTAVIGNAEYDLQLDETISENASCQSCSDDFAATYLIEYEHKEGQSGGNKQAQLRLRLFLNGIHISSLTSTTHNFYNFKGINPSNNIDTYSTTQPPSTSPGRYGSSSVKSNISTVLDTKKQAIPPDNIFYIALSFFIFVSLVVLILYALCLCRN